METYIGILRGINVSGHKPIKMEKLKSICSELKFQNIKTYIQSGNIIFQFKKSKPELIGKLLADKIETEFGFEVPVLILTKKSIQEVFDQNPFLEHPKNDVSKLHVTFLSTEPDNSLVKNIEQVKFEPDEFAVSGKSIYLFCPNGYGNTKLSNTFFEKKLNVQATTRNWKTVTELLKLAEG